jgi:hypothetical protein
LTLGNMRANGVRTLAAWCLGRRQKNPGLPGEGDQG